MTTESIAGRLSQANGRLKAARVGVQIEQHGSKLYLRATLLPKPGSNKSLPFQSYCQIWCTQKN